MSERAGFAGFSRQLPQILTELQANNTREWYLVHRDEYARCVLEPLRALGEALTPIAISADDRLEFRLSRPHRDTRFSANKSPYRTEAWFVFRQPVSDWLDTPAFFLEVSPNACRRGMGFYAASPRTMAAIRETMAARPTPYLRALEEATASGFSVMGDEYRRAPCVERTLPAPLARVHGLRNIYLSMNAQYEEGFFRPGFAERVAEGFEALTPLYRLLRSVADRLRDETGHHDARRRRASRT